MNDLAKRYRIQVIDRDRSLVLLDASVIGTAAAVDIFRAAALNTDLPNALRIEVDQLVPVGA
jgi:hypothetical protein